MTFRIITGLAAFSLCSGFVGCSVKSSKNSDTDGTTNTSNGGGGGSSSGGSSSGSSSSSSSGGSAGADAGGANASGGATGGAGSGEAGAAGDLSGGTGRSTATGGTASGGTSSTAGGGSGSMTSDSCSNSDIEPNEDRDGATLYEIGSQFQGCLQSVDDVDFYEFSVPSDDRGGVVTVNITDVGSDGDTRVALWSVADNGEIHSTGTNVEGASVFFNFNAKAGAAFRLEITNYLTVNNPNPYLLSVTYDQVPDLYEPNDVRSAAAPIEIGQNVEAYAFAGWESSTAIPEADWFDWYEIELEVGATEFLMDVMASDIDSEIYLYNPLGTEIAKQQTNIEGSSLLMTYDIAEAGTYFLRLGPYIPPGTVRNTNNVPQYATVPYTLTVTQ